MHVLVFDKSRYFGCVYFTNVVNHSKHIAISTLDDIADVLDDIFFVEVAKYMHFL